jgi:hypothetical protein
MKLTAELLAQELIEKDDEERDMTLTLSCVEFEKENVILHLDGKKYQVDGTALIEALVRISFPEGYVQR